MLQVKIWSSVWTRTSTPFSLLISSLRRLRCLAQSAIVLQPSPSDLLSGKSGMISILKILSEKLLSLKANPKSDSESNNSCRLLSSPFFEQQESMVVLGFANSITGIQRLMKIIKYPVPTNPSP
uniref:Uncharacterized protein n=1 Tax=Opuntia streptacantha TaxID=393608 RepID=A0A7C9CUU2_OPUST